MTYQPNRRQFLRCAAAGTLALLAPSGEAGYAQQSRRPNLLVIFADDWVYRAIGYNNPIVQTPNLDRLASGGTIFEHAYVASPICVASRSSILTSLFPQQHGSVALDQTGFLTNVVDQGKYRTFAHDLTDAGYVTGFCGKSHLKSPLEYGFTEGKENGDYNDLTTFADAAQFLAGRKGKESPFLLWVAPHQPHVPLLPEQEFLDLYKEANIQPDPNFMEKPPKGSLYNQGKPGEQYYRDSEYVKNYNDLPSGPPRTRDQIVEFTRAYYATISHLDRQIGELISNLKDSGHYENTVILFLADNGYHLGNHGLGNKITMHEESVRVPMLAHGPGVVKEGARSKALVSSLDIYPTLLDLAGIRLPDHIQGRSLTPVFANPNATVRDYVFSECTGVGATVGMGHRMIRGDRWKYVLTDTNEEALFDQLDDPFELKNVISDPANVAVVTELRGRLSQWMDAIVDTHQRPGQ
ncbi:MAG: arylsulfatase [Candidatus Hydrogenedentota bacterium]